MSKKQIFKVVKGSLFMVIGFGLIISLLISGTQVFQKQDDIDALEQQKAIVAQEKEDLENEVNLLNDDDYVTRYARENYIFTRDGEQVAIIPEDKTDEE